MDSRAYLESEGFEGFHLVGQLHAERCEGLPDAAGIYAIVRETPGPPEFMARSTAPVYRGEDPSRPVEELMARWVPGAELLYLGLAAGPGVRNLLKQRVKRMLRFGHGRVVGHWGGRFVWQLLDRAALRVAWNVTGDADAGERIGFILARFVEKHGVLPFANGASAGDE